MVSLIVPIHYLLFNIFKLLDILYFDIVWVVCQQVDGIGHYVLRQQREQLVCRHTQGKYYSVVTPVLMITATCAVVHYKESRLCFFSIG